MDHNDRSLRLIDEMNRYYEARAPWHDEYMSYESNEVMESRLAPVVDLLVPEVKEKRVIEIACGTGNWTYVLAKRAEAVTGIDVSPGALEIARCKLSDFNNVTLVQGDAYDLNAIPGTFDVVFGADWWSHIPVAMIPAFLDTITGKLRSGGRAIFLDMLFRNAFREEPDYRDPDDNRVFRRSLPNGAEFEVVKNFPTETDFHRMLSQRAVAMEYFRFEELERWMVSMELRKSGRVRGEAGRR